MRLGFVVSAVLIVVLLALVACGDDDPPITSPTIEVPQDTAPAPTFQIRQQPDPVQELVGEPLPAADALIGITARETLFVPNSWAAVLGEAVTIRLENADGTAHNIRIAGPDGEYNTDDDAVTTPDSVAPGDAGELSFAPQVAGNYTFRCDFHPDRMGGRIEVE